MDISREELGKRLELLRTIRGRTQEAFGQPINMNRDVVCRVERGKRDILALELARLARHYCFRIEPLLEVRADGTWDITACLLPWPAPEAGLPGESGGPRHTTTPEQPGATP